MEVIIQLRHTLHRHPELSGQEQQAALRILKYFRPLQPDTVMEGLSGAGLALIFNGESPGPAILLRCELDALPIQELGQKDYGSLTEGIAHQCGHDGHMAIMAAVGDQLAVRRPARGSVILLFQPAEETGSGARAVVKDPRFAKIKPDFAFALHNLPGYPVGQILLRSGSFNAASRGMEILLQGSTAHAAQPETGNSPAVAMCAIIEQLNKLPAQFRVTDEMTFATVVGARLGDKAFGTAPAKARIWVTLRSATDEGMSRLVGFVEHRTQQIAAQENLDYEWHYEDIFAATVNDPEAVAIVHRSAGPLSVQEMITPFRWSEDFGCITAVCQGALFGLGAGIDRPDLHNPDYDFPDDLIEPAAALFLRIIENCLE